VIGGWLPGEGRRRDRIGALLVGFHDDGDLFAPVLTVVQVLPPAG
jgi:ATP-dependent DNA ligase